MNKVFLGRPSPAVEAWIARRQSEETVFVFADGTTEPKRVEGAMTWEKFRDWGWITPDGPDYDGDGVIDEIMQWRWSHKNIREIRFGSLVTDI